jgi:hypothetical protein
MKLADTAVKDPEALTWYPLNHDKRHAPTRTGEEPREDDGEDVKPSSVAEKDATIGEIPTKNNPIIVTIYGQICIAAQETHRDSLTSRTRRPLALVPQKNQTGAKSSQLNPRQCTVLPISEFLLCVHGFLTCDK